MQQSSRLDGLSLDPFSSPEDGVAASEADIGQGQDLHALVVALMIAVVDRAVVDKGLDPVLETA